MAAAFAGNDIVDLASPALLARAAERSAVQVRWRDRHLTMRERNSGGPFWSLFAAKEAAWKAFAQAGIEAARGSFRDFEVDLAEARVEHLPSGLRGSIARLEQDADRVHCVVVFGQPGMARLADSVTLVRGGDSPGDAARETLLRLAVSVLGGSTSRFAVGWSGGAPALLESGRYRDASVSLAHSGRFAAASLLCA